MAVQKSKVTRSHVFRLFLKFFQNGEGARILLRSECTISLWGR